MRIRRQGASLVVDTPAKLNLFLEVLGRRSDGYHSLETVMVSVGVFDTLQFAPTVTPGVSLTVTPAVPLRHADCPIDDSNLILKGARLLQDWQLKVRGRSSGSKEMSAPSESGETLSGVAIHLTKRIPLQAGMGGGSSDGAATLVGLNQFWNLGLSSAELHQFASQLGSDVNLFVDSCPLAVCRGRGEEVTSASLGRRFWVVVAQPPVGLSTAAVFHQWKPTDAPESALPLLRSLETGTLAGMSTRIRNALQQPAERLSPEVSGLLELLRREGAVASGMTGSGSACFAIGRSRRECQRIAGRLKGRGGYWVGVMKCSS